MRMKLHGTGYFVVTGSIEISYIPMNIIGM